MKKSQTLTLSKKKYIFPILDSIETEIEVTENPYKLEIKRLFTMAARINKKRSFLFVSKVLGKHLPINPHKGLVTAALLAARYSESVLGRDCNGETEELISLFHNEKHYRSIPFIPASVNPVIIGFAETATALGQAFFDCFQQADYFHTTREELAGRQPDITFEEEHSHATSHRCYIKLETLDNDREIILVDDEMTTGKTALNIIRSLHERFPRKEYSVVSILDWRSEQDRQKFSRLEHELGITIHAVSLLSGHVHVRTLKELERQASEIATTEQEDMTVEALDLEAFFIPTEFSSIKQENSALFINETGRFGLSSLENQLLHETIVRAGQYLSSYRNGRRTLCLGTGEFIYLPMKLAAEMGSGIFFQSTTRSPIYVANEVGYGARYGLAFPSPEDNDVAHFVYNIPPDHYDELFLFFEREPSLKALEPFLQELAKTKIKSVKLVSCSKERGLICRS
ncbi:phosphoribosyltransferase family protein [Neobacillus dielmonensis]|uniref:phosphoribosyltransferase family protein n=1 Tax=Neobacillus dielmonensis TaxID=1347369 RepID=UPI001F1E5682|nr:phosphoribosyltransferase family protein [Neobacillus dielmonensis]